jgi:hypothetical protein
LRRRRCGPVLCPRRRVLNNGIPDRDLAGQRSPPDAWDRGDISRNGRCCNVVAKRPHLGRRTFSMSYR